MAKPKVFVSSTYYDLKHIRSSLEDFINELGYESVLSESGNIAYNPEVSLDVSCYKEVSNADIFVLIIGGRYGSPISAEDKETKKTFFDKYDSVTREEYNNASKKVIPTYILIEKQVYAEYQTYKINKENKYIKYAHVDSVNIFKFIDEIQSKSKNNATHQFEKHSEIKEWLREQWAGLFRDLLNQKIGEEQFNSLNEKIAELSSLNTSMKNYLENMITGHTENPGKLIEDAQNREKEERKLRELYKLYMFSNLVLELNVKEDDAISYYLKAKSLEDFADIIKNNVSLIKTTKNELLTKWSNDNNHVEQINKVRKILGESELEFEN